MHHVYRSDLTDPFFVKRDNCESYCKQLKRNVDRRASGFVVGGKGGWTAVNFFGWVVSRNQSRISATAFEGLVSQDTLTRAHFCPQFILQTWYGK